MAKFRSKKQATEEIIEDVVLTEEPIIEEDVVLTEEQPENVIEAPETDVVVTTEKEVKAKPQSLVDFLF